MNKISSTSSIPVFPPIATSFPSLCEPLVQVTLDEEDCLEDILVEQFRLRGALLDEQWLKPEICNLAMPALDQETVELIGKHPPLNLIKDVLEKIWAAIPDRDEAVALHWIGGDARAILSKVLLSAFNQLLISVGLERFQRKELTDLYPRQNDTDLKFVLHRKKFEVLEKLHQIAQAEVELNPKLVWEKVSACDECSQNSYITTAISTLDQHNFDVALVRGYLRNSLFLRDALGVMLKQGRRGDSSASPEIPRWFIDYHQPWQVVFDIFTKYIHIDHIETMNWMGLVRAWKLLSQGYRFANDQDPQTLYQKVIQAQKKVGAVLLKCHFAHDAGQPEPFLFTFLCGCPTLLKNQVSCQGLWERLKKHFKPETPALSIHQTLWNCLDKNPVGVALPMVELFSLLKLALNRVQGSVKVRISFNYGKPALRLEGQYVMWMPLDLPALYDKLRLMQEPSAEGKQQLLGLLDMLAFPETCEREKPNLLQVHRQKFNLDEIQFSHQVTQNYHKQTNAFQRWIHYLMVTVLQSLEPEPRKTEFLIQEFIHMGHHFLDDGQRVTFLTFLQSLSSKHATFLKAAQGFIPLFTNFDQLNDWWKWKFTGLQIGFEKKWNYLRKSFHFYPQDAFEILKNENGISSVSKDEIFEMLDSLSSFIPFSTFVTQTTHHLKKRELLISNKTEAFLLRMLSEGKQKKLWGSLYELLVELSQEEAFEHHEDCGGFFLKVEELLERDVYSQELLLQEETISGSLTDKLILDYDYNLPSFFKKNGYRFFYKLHESDTNSKVLAFLLKKFPEVQTLLKPEVKQEIYQSLIKKAPHGQNFLDSAIALSSTLEGRSLDLFWKWRLENYPLSAEQRWGYLKHLMHLCPQESWEVYRSILNQSSPALQKVKGSLSDRLQTLIHFLPWIDFLSVYEQALHLIKKISKNASFPAEVPFFSLIKEGLAQKQGLKVFECFKCLFSKGWAAYLTETEINLWLKLGEQLLEEGLAGGILVWELGNQMALWTSPAIKKASQPFFEHLYISILTQEKEKEYQECLGYLHQVFCFIEAKKTKETLQVALLADFSQALIHLYHCLKAKALKPLEEEAVLNNFMERHQQLKDVPYFQNRLLAMVLCEYLTKAKKISVKKDLLGKQLLSLVDKISEEDLFKLLKVCLRQWQRNLLDKKNCDELFQRSLGYTIDHQKMILAGKIWRLGQDVLLWKSSLKNPDFQKKIIQLYFHSLPLKIEEDRKCLLESIQLEFLPQAFKGESNELSILIREKIHSLTHTGSNSRVLLSKYAAHFNRDEKMDLLQAMAWREIENNKTETWGEIFKELVLLQGANPEGFKRVWQSLKPFLTKMQTEKQLQFLISFFLGKSLKNILSPSHQMKLAVRILKFFGKTQPSFLLSAYLHKIIQKLGPEISLSQKCFLTIHQLILQQSTIQWVYNEKTMLLEAKPLGEENFSLKKKLIESFWVLVELYDRYQLEHELFEFIRFIYDCRMLGTVAVNSQQLKTIWDIFHKVMAKYPNESKWICQTHQFFALMQAPPFDRSLIELKTKFCLQTIKQIYEVQQTMAISDKQEIHPFLWSRIHDILTLQTYVSKEKQAAEDIKEAIHYFFCLIDDASPSDVSLFLCKHAVMIREYAEASRLDGILKGIQKDFFRLLKEVFQAEYVDVAMNLIESYGVIEVDSFIDFLTYWDQSTDFIYYPFSRLYRNLNIRNPSLVQPSQHAVILRLILNLYLTAKSDHVFDFCQSLKKDLEGVSLEKTQDFLLQLTKGLRDYQDISTETILKLIRDIKDLSQLSVNMSDNLIQLCFKRFGDRDETILGAACEMFCNSLKGLPPKDQVIHLGDFFNRLSRFYNGDALHRSLGSLKEHLEGLNAFSAEISQFCAQLTYKIPFNQSFSDRLFEHNFMEFFTLFTKGMLEGDHDQDKRAFDYINEALRRKIWKQTNSNEWAPFIQNLNARLLFKDYLPSKAQFFKFIVSDIDGMQDFVITAGTLWFLKVEKKGVLQGLTVQEKKTLYLFAKNLLSLRVLENDSQNVLPRLKPFLSKAEFESLIVIHQVEELLFRNKTDGTKAVEAKKPSVLPAQCLDLTRNSIIADCFTYMREKKTLDFSLYLKNSLSLFAFLFCKKEVKASFEAFIRQLLEVAQDNPAVFSANYFTLIKHRAITEGYWRNGISLDITAPLIGGAQGLECDLENEYKKISFPWYSLKDRAPFLLHLKIWLEDLIKTSHDFNPKDDKTVLFTLLYFLNLLCEVCIQENDISEADLKDLFSLISQFLYTRLNERHRLLNMALFHSLKKNLDRFDLNQSFLKFRQADWFLLFYYNHKRDKLRNSEKNGERLLKIKGLLLDYYSQIFETFNGFSAIGLPKIFEHPLKECFSADDRRGLYKKALIHMINNPLEAFSDSICYQPLIVYFFQSTKKLKNPEAQDLMEAYFTATAEAYKKHPSYPLADFILCAFAEFYLMDPKRRQESKTAAMWKQMEETFSSTLISLDPVSQEKLKKALGMIYDKQQPQSLKM